MRIERIDEFTVKCFLSNEELEEYDIDYKDFIMRSDKAREVMQEIVTQASEEVGYVPPKCSFDLQIMLVPDQGLILTFSEKDQMMRDGERLIECLREMKRILKTANAEMAKRALEELAANPLDVLPNAEDAGAKEMKPETAVFRFTAMRSVMGYAAALPSNLRIGSELYEQDGSYYLCMTKGRAAYHRFTKACVQAMEFGELYTVFEPKVLSLKESGVCLIPEKAIKRLAAVVRKAGDRIS